MSEKSWLWTAGCLMGATGVAFGAFGAHALKRFVTFPQQLRSWEMAGHYQLFHAVPVLLSAVATKADEAPDLGAWLICAGTALFSGSIYALVLQPKWRILGPVTPIGGLLLISGWLSLAFKTVRTV